YLQVEFAGGDCKSLGMTIMRYDKPIAGQRQSNILAVGIGNKSCLEMQTGRQFIRREDGAVVFTHNGAINVGGASSAHALRLLSERVPDLCEHERQRVVFGRLNARPTDDDWA